MLPRTSLPTLTVAAVALLAAPATAQFTPSTYRNLLPSAVPHLDDEGLRKELKVTTAQAQKLSEVQERWGSQATTAARGSSARGQDAALEIEKVLTEALQPPQLKRLKQILLQDLEKRYGFIRPASYTEVIAALKLTDEQRAQLTSARFDGRTANVLTPDQQAKWKELIGEPYADRLGAPASPFARWGTSSAFTVGPPMPVLTWLQTAAVQREVKVSAEQLRQLADVERSRDAALNRYVLLAPEEQRAKLAEANRGAWEAMARVFQPEQMKRLRQIEGQQDRRHLGELDFLRSEVVRQGLKVTATQAEKMNALVKGCRETMRQAVLSADPAEKIEARLAACQKETHDGLLAVLTEEQRSGLKDVLGVPFELPARADRGGRGTFDRGAAPAARPAAGPLSDVGRFSNLTPTLLQNEDVQKELRLTADQLKAVPGLESLGSGTAAGADAVERLLDAKQVVRLRQLRLQQVTRMAGPACVFRYREVVEALQLTPEQQTKLRPALEEAVGEYLTRTQAGSDAPVSEEVRKSGERQLAEILTAEQQKKLAALYGEPFKGSLTPQPPAARPAPAARPGLPGPGTLSTRGAELGSATNLTVALLALDAVQRELRLTAEQLRKVPELTTRRSSIASTRAPEADVERVLNADQVRRLRQLSLQQMERLAGAGYLLSYREVIEALRPSEEQVARLQTILEEASRASPSRSTSVLPAEQRKKLQAQLDAVLTPEQRRAFADTLGEPFAGELPQQTPDRGAPSRSSRDRGGPAFGRAGFPAGFARRAPTLAMLRQLSQPDVREDLKLTLDQAEKVQDVAAKRDEALRDYATLPTAERSKKLADANAAAEKAVEGILDARQGKRLKQILLQQRGELVIEGGPDVPGYSIFAEADIAAELKVSAEQQAKIQAIVQNAVKVRQLIERQQWGQTPAPLDEHRAAVVERVRGVLTKEQREKWLDLIGEPLKRRPGPFSASGSPP